MRYARLKGDAQIGRLYNKAVLYRMFYSKKDEIDMAVVIRKAGPKDLDALLKLSQQLIQFDYQFDSTMDVRWPVSESGRRYFCECLSREDSIVLLAESDQEVVGYLIGSKIEADEFRTISVLAELEELYISASHRGRDIGFRLWSAFLDWCREKNLSRISVSVTAANQKAISFYKKIGFQEQYLTLERDL